MKKSIYKLSFFVAAIVVIFYSCQEATIEEQSDLSSYDLNAYDYFDDLPEDVSQNFRTNTSDEVAALGRLLFYDTNFSALNNVSCATCHSQSRAFADAKKISPGVFGEKTSRNSMGLSYAGFQARFFWDSRSRRLADAVLEPILNHSEMAIESMDVLVEKLAATSLYPDLFSEAFENQPNFVDEGVTPEKIGTALASFIASLYTYDSKYDRGVEYDFTNFNKAETEGKDLFFGKAKCGSCHIDYNMGSYYQNTSIGLDEIYEDEGAGNGTFKVPHLRNIALTGPYMHDGRFETLEEVVEHYNSGVKKSANLSWHLSDENKDPIRLNLSSEEKESLVAFLHTLTDNSITTLKKYSNPF